ncbi:MAG: Flp pilus assembly complex ATPase component TadA [Sedimentisphaerales bacterium]|nr:Flp pilus assembly complex ATPase component TadA [Sedimentisphaerales bacterium]
MARKRKKLGDILVSWGVLNDKQIQDAVAHSESTHHRLGEALVEMGLVDEEQVTKAMATQFDLEYVDLDHHVVDRSALELMPDDLMRRYLILPIGKENGRLKIIIHDPLDLDTMDLLRFRLNTELECALASKSKIKRYIDTFLDKVHSSLDATVDELHKSIDSSIDASIDLESLAESKLEDDSAPVIKLINKIIGEAVKLRASDVHVEPMTDRVRVRYRIDGVCAERDNIPKQLQPVVLTRLKIMSGMDIAERRVPQDGRIKQNFGGSDIDFRVSALPGYHGESVVLRILRPESVRVGIQALGFADDDYKRFLRIIKRPNGIFLVTGPTGSGKTTTLYAALQELNRPDKKIITAEDPVEYNFSGMNQCQVRTDIGLTFSVILRSMLRQAPNIILVGEIRDLEVAEIAIQAALTGHLVFSTLHTNDAPSAITRLIDMGVKPFLVASAIQAIMAQRLVRKICQDCRQEQLEPETKYLKLLNFTQENLAEKSVYHGAGCSRCHQTGYHGRIGIFEMMLMNTEIREMAFRREPTNKIRAAAVASGMRRLIEDGKLKILEGITTLAEVARVAQAEDIEITLE